MSSPTGPATRWVDVCALDDLVSDRGVGAILGRRQVALFRLSSGELYAIGNRDPFSGANVLARGLVGSDGAVPKVASPIYKQAFDLRSGACLSDPDVRVATFPARVNGGRVELLDGATSSRPDPSCPDPSCPPEPNPPRRNEQ